MKHIKLFEEFTNINENVKFGKAGIKAKLADKLKIAQMAIDKWGDMYQPMYDKVEKYIKAGKIDANNILMVQGDEPKSDYEIFKGNNAIKLAQEIAKVIKKYKKYEVDQTTTGAAAGWSGTARATVGGKIEGHVNFSPGYDDYLIAVTVGGGVDSKIRDKIFQEVYELMFLFDEYNSSDGGVSIDTTGGTNYHTFGLQSSEYQFNKNTATKLENIMNS